MNEQLKKTIKSYSLLVDIINLGNIDNRDSVLISVKSKENDDLALTQVCENDENTQNIILKNLITRKLEIERTKSKSNLTDSKVLLKG